MSKPGILFTRREFNRKLGLSGAGLAFLQNKEAVLQAKYPVVLARGDDRNAMVRDTVAGLDNIRFAGRTVYLKANFNSADPYPATTHPEMLAAVSGMLYERGCEKIFLVERSGMGSAQDIWNKLKIAKLAEQLKLQLLPLEGADFSDWRKEPLPGSHWKAGVEVPGFLTHECCVVQIANIKTHRFGGQFSGSLKNSIGLIAKRDSKNPAINYMAELHESRHQRLMLAEVNQVYSPSLVIMDAMEVFIDGGPERGERAIPGIVAASSDRIAIDAVGVALLRIQGAGAPLNHSGIFALEQIKRAVELDLGAKSADEIDLKSGNSDGRIAVEQVTAQLKSPLPEKN